MILKKSLKDSGRRELNQACTYAFSPQPIPISSNEKHKQLVDQVLQANQTSIAKASADHQQSRVRGSGSDFPALESPGKRPRSGGVLTRSSPLPLVEYRERCALLDAAPTLRRSRAAPMARRRRAPHPRACSRQRRRLLPRPRTASPAGQRRASLRTARLSASACACCMTIVHIYYIGETDRERERKRDVGTLRRDLGSGIRLRGLKLASKPMQSLFEFHGSKISSAPSWWASRRGAERGIGSTGFRASPKAPPPRQGAIREGRASCARGRQQGDTRKRVGGSARRRLFGAGRGALGRGGCVDGSRVAKGCSRVCSPARTRVHAMRCPPPLLSRSHRSPAGRSSTGEATLPNKSGRVVGGDFPSNSPQAREPEPPGVKPQTSGGEVSQNTSPRSVLARCTLSRVATTPLWRRCEISGEAGVLRSKMMPSLCCARVVTSALLRRLRPD